MKFQNPYNDLGELEFPSQEAYNDFLMNEFNSLVDAETFATTHKRAVARLLDKQCSDPKESGTVKLRGDVFQASIIRGVIPKYSVLNKDEEPILQQLYTSVESTREFIRVSFDERLAGMNKWLKQQQDSNFEELSAAELELVNRFLSIRYMQPTSPQVKITRIAEEQVVTSGEEKP